MRRARRSPVEEMIVESGRAATCSRKNRAAPRRVPVPARNQPRPTYIIFMTPLKTHAFLPTPPHNNLPRPPRTLPGWTSAPILLAATLARYAD